jgi:PIN domain nuclease of toxin-antitoxin system
MKLLLDSQVWFWTASAPEKVGSAALMRITEPTNQVFLSVASVWELAIMYEQGRLLLPEPVRPYVEERLACEPVTLLTVDLEHALVAASLPRIHRDPFDRLLVAQAMTEGMTLVSADRLLSDYHVPTLIV